MAAPFFVPKVKPLVILRSAVSDEGSLQLFRMRNHPRLWPHFSLLLREVVPIHDYHSLNPWETDLFFERDPTMFAKTGQTWGTPIDGNWSLEDLYVFPRAYEQCYFMYLALAAPPQAADDERIARAYEAFPWQGGYSAVDFYNQLKWSVPKRKRPTIIRIRYGSPGIIELGGLLVSVAVIVERVVHTLCKAAREANQTYSAIHRDLQKRRLLRIKTDNEIRKLTPPGTGQDKRAGERTGGDPRRRCGKAERTN